MQIKRYTLASLILIVLVGWYVYAFVSQQSVSIELFGISLPSLSIAIWVTLPLILLYFASVMHMSFYSFLGNMKLRKYEKDYEKIVDAIVDAYLGKENRSYTYKTQRYQLLGALVDNATIMPNGNFDSTIEDKRISEVLDLVKKIKNGESVELKKYSLPSFNQFSIQNAKNKYKNGELSEEEILSNMSKYDDSIGQEAYKNFVKVAPLHAIEKYKSSLTKEALFNILARVNANENTLDISNDALIALFNDLDLTTREYVKISQALSKSMLPEQRIKLFETISNNDESKIKAYLFTLFDLEMLEPAREILDNTQDDEHPYLKAYFALRESGKNFDVNLIFVDA